MEDGSWSSGTVTNTDYDGTRAIYPMRYAMRPDDDNLAMSSVAGVAAVRTQGLSHGVKERNSSNTPTVSYMPVRLFPILTRFGSAGRHD